jgi:hypothetical protein
MFGRYQQDGPRGDPGNGLHPARVEPPDARFRPGAEHIF